MSVAAPASRAAGRHLRAGPATVYVSPVPPAGPAGAALHEVCRVLLSPAEAARLAAMRDAETGRHFAAARALLRCCLARHAPVPAAAWQLDPAATGRLEVAGPSAGQGLHVSLSHCRGWVACAIAGERCVGVDVELPGRRLADVSRLAARLSAPERAAIAALPRGRRGPYLLRLWTLKEAFAKALGRGLALPLSATAFAPGATVAAHLAGAGEDPAAWLFAQRRLRGGPWLAVALRGVDVAGDGWLAIHRLRPLIDAAGGVRFAARAPARVSAVAPPPGAAPPPFSGVASGRQKR